MMTGVLNPAVISLPAFSTVLVCCKVVFISFSEANRLFSKALFFCDGFELLPLSAHRGLSVTFI
jgi:hypothetical protein